MSAVLALVEEERARDPGVAAVMLAAMGHRGSERTGWWSDAAVKLGVSRNGWEMGAEFSGDALVVADANAAVAADASLFYRSDLERRLGASGVSATGPTPSHLVLAAYRAWGTDCARHLEGDFAFVLWDRRERRLFAARDFAGKRALYYVELPRGFAVASTVGALLRHPACDRELNLAAVAEDAAGLTGSPVETSFRSVRRLPSGCSLTWSAEHGVKVARFWQAPEVRDAGGPPFREGSAQLRELLRDATRERLVPNGTTGIWLSGGWDSTAVFGVGQDLLREQGGGRLLPVSMSYPPNDPGHEDWLIEAAAAHWNAPVSWLSIGDIPFWDRADARAAARDEPFAHVFETWNRALGARSATLGAHANLDGTGGDQLFQVSNVYFADLLRRGRWLGLMREWRAKRLGRPRPQPVAEYLLRPLLPSSIVDLVATLRGARGWPGHLGRALPDWLDTGFVAQQRLREREREHNSVRWRGERAAVETAWYLRFPHFHRISGCIFELALEEGVELRSPLFDERVVRFAVSRPRWERSSGMQTKLLLRHSVRDLLPPLLTAPRRWRTGVTTGFFEHSMRGAYREVLQDAFQRPVLAELGIVDEGRLRQTCARFLRGEAGDTGLPLFLASQTELWLRARLGDRRAKQGGCVWGVPTPDLGPAHDLGIRHTMGTAVAAAQPGEGPGIVTSIGGIRCT